MSTDDARVVDDLVAMAANAMRGDREARLAAGMDACVTKPIRVDAVVDSSTRCKVRTESRR